jgi:hypothetical protein
MKKNGGVREETMTGPRESDRELMMSEIDQIKERIRTGERLDPKQVARELDANPLTVGRIIKTLLWLEAMKDSRDSTLEKSE